MKKALLFLAISVTVLAVGLYLPYYSFSGGIIGGAEDCVKHLTNSLFIANAIKLLVCLIGTVGTIISGIFVIKNRRK